MDTSSIGAMDASKKTKDVDGARKRTASKVIHDKLLHSLRIQHLEEQLGKATEKLDEFKGTMMVCLETMLEKTTVEEMREDVEYMMSVLNEEESD